MTDIASPSAYDADERVATRQAETLAEEKWRTLCTQHASTFVAAERRTSSIKSALKELLSKIVDETKPSVQRVGYALDPEGKDVEEEEGEKIQPASELLADLAEKHRLRRRTLMQHSSLLELLELPSLMDACVRSSLYEDALSIAAFANTLERRHLMDNTQKQEGEHGEHQNKRGVVVAGVISEIRRREADLRRQLIHRLRGDVTMPQCLEVVTALRRLNGVELERRGRGGKGSSGGGSGTDADYLESVHAAMELRLQVDFLEARDVWLEGGVSKVGSAQAAAAAAASSSATGLEKGTSAQAEQILDGIERYRTRCFEIVTQYLAIFRGSFATSTSSSNENDHSHSLLSMWTSRRIQTFLTTLHTNMVTHVHDTATLRDALDSASFFASSMGRVGADFQSLLGPIFEPRLAEMIISHWNDGLNSMTETLRACRDGGIAGPLYGTETSAGKDENDANNDVAEVQSSRTPSPPRKLLAIPPLARFVNAYLNGLNELRRCLLPGSFPAIRVAHAKLIADVKMALQTNERVVLTPGLRGEAAQLREAASRMKSEFDSCVEPYMSSCLEVAFGSLDYAFVEAEKARAIEKAKADAIAAEKAERLRLENERLAEEARLAAEAKAKAEKEAAQKEAAENAEKEAAKEVEQDEATEMTDITSNNPEAMPSVPSNDADGDFFDEDV